MSDFKPLTDRQQKVLDVVRQYCAEKGYPPSIRELMPMLGISSLRGVTIHLDALEHKGWIRRESTSRSIQILEQPANNCIPILGDSSNKTIGIPPQLSNESGEIIAVKVNDNAMQSVHIVSGDIVFIRVNADPEDGQIVAAKSGNEVLIRRLDKVLGKLIASSFGNERIIDAGTKILGTVALLIRSYGPEAQTRTTD